MLGLSTYAYLWRRHADAPGRFGLPEVFADAARLGVALVQVCDVAELETATHAWLRQTHALASDLGLALETGTKGVEPTHLRHHLACAEALGARFVRSMVSSPRGMPTLAEAEGWLRDVLPAYEDAGVTLGLETYEQVPSADLVALVERIGSPALGICLDPGNAVAGLEHPADVVRRCAPHVVNLHVKDFRFTRAESMVGFAFAGAPLGQGLLDYDAMVDALDAAGRQVNHVVEHWLPRQTTLAETCALESSWVDASVAWLRARGRCN